MLRVIRGDVLFRLHPLHRPSVVSTIRRLKVHLRTIMDAFHAVAQLLTRIVQIRRRAIKY